ncbi:MAG TPA: NfeD family protein, partial [Phenylobacterium sp.]|nr:NfeD family protein [Phenylobacterium sp.]
MDGLIHLAVANPFWVWAGVGAVLLAAEVATSTGWLLWPAASAGLVAVISLILPLDWLATGSLFAALTIATSLTARRYMHLAKAVRGGHDINDNVARLVGHHGKT